MPNSLWNRESDATSGILLSESRISCIIGSYDCIGQVKHRFRVPTGMVALMKVIEAKSAGGLKVLQTPLDRFRKPVASLNDHVKHRH